MNVVLGTRLLLSKAFVESGKIVREAPQVVSDEMALDFLPSRGTLYFQIHRVLEGQTIEPFYEGANAHALAETPVYLVGTAQHKREMRSFSHEWSMMLMEETGDCLIGTHPQIGSYIFGYRPMPELTHPDQRVNMIQALRMNERPEYKNDQSVLAIA